MKIWTTDAIDLSQIPYEMKTIGASKRIKPATEYFLSHLFARQQTRNERENQFICIHSGYFLTPWFGNRRASAAVIGQLEHRGIVEQDGLAQWRKRSMGYRLTTEYLDAEWTCQEAQIPESITNPSDRERLEFLGIDTPLAIEILGQIKGEREWNEIQAACWKWYVENFDNSYSVCKTKRLFTLGNRLPKEVRLALLIDGDKTAELDVKNCQPLLWSTLLRDGKERTRYLDLVERGVLYETAQEALALESRDAAKQRVIQWTYGKGDKEVGSWIQDSFPELHAEILRRRKPEYRRLCWDMQKLESKLIRMAVTVPHMSVHDGVRVREGDVESAKQSIERAFSSERLNPRIELC